MTYRVISGRQRIKPDCYKFRISHPIDTHNYTVRLFLQKPHCCFCLPFAYMEQGPENRCSTTASRNIQPLHTASLIQHMHSSPTTHVPHPLPMSLTHRLHPSPATRIPHLRSASLTSDLHPSPTTYIPHPQPASFNHHPCPSSSAFIPHPPPAFCHPGLWRHV